MNSSLQAKTGEKGFLSYLFDVSLDRLALLQVPTSRVNEEDVDGAAQAVRKAAHEGHDHGEDLLQGGEHSVVLMSLTSGRRVKLTPLREGEIAGVRRVFRAPEGAGRGVAAMAHAAGSCERGG